jgi:precorrin-3B synthase
MNARAPARRGACPGLSAPMPTGDGLLARLVPTGTIALDALAGVAAAARRHGNSIVEITSRGSIQIRGLTPASAPAFGDAVARLGIAAHDGVPVIADPLAGLDPDEVVDAGALATALRHALAARPFTDRLSAKVSIAIDGGGALHLDALSADIRLRATPSPDGPRLHVALGGAAATAAARGTIMPADAIDTVMRLLDAIAARGPQARARDVLGDAGGSPPALRAAADPIGRHRLRRDASAIGIGFAFGHTDAGTLNMLIHAAQDAGATGLRTSPGRALLFVGIAADRVTPFVGAAGKRGFIVDRNDPRRRVVACAGAPICASAEIPARALAPEVAKTAAPLIAATDVIHISGCAKGCAHHGPAALTAIGRAGQCDLFVDGAPAGSVAVEALSEHLARLAHRRSAGHG